MRGVAKQGKDRGDRAWCTRKRLTTDFPGKKGPGLEHLPISVAKCPSFQTTTVLSPEVELKETQAASLVGTGDKNLPASEEDTGLIPGPGRFHRPRSN